MQGGVSTLFWFDGWLGGRAPRDLWPDIFATNQHSFAMINDIAHMFLSELREVDPSLDDLKSSIGSETRNMKR